MEKLTDKELKELARQEKNRYQKAWYEKKKKQGIDKRQEYADNYWNKRALERLKKGGK